jgi:hypothetical protein
MNRPEDYAGYWLFLCQELILDSATPGKFAAARLVQNATLLRDSVEQWALYCGWKPDELLAKVWAHDKDAAKRQIEREKHATGRKAR